MALLQSRGPPQLLTLTASGILSGGNVVIAASAPTNASEQRSGHKEILPNLIRSLPSPLVLPYVKNTAAATKKECFLEGGQRRKKTSRNGYATKYFHGRWFSAFRNAADHHDSATTHQRPRYIDPQTQWSALTRLRTEKASGRAPRAGRTQTKKKLPVSTKSGSSPIALDGQTEQRKKQA
ncbi:hypothetical protein MRX96_051109 [Rhipicephalus microplus]